jgi:hypothetical protein
MALDSDMINNADVDIRPLESNVKNANRGIGLVWRPSYQRHATIDQLIRIFKDSLEAG